MGPPRMDRHDLGQPFSRMKSGRLLRIFLWTRPRLILLRLLSLQVYLMFNTIIHRQQAPFSGAVAGEQVIKIRSFIAFCVIFSFLLVFLFASTKF
jgi:hypothetical protein